MTATVPNRQPSQEVQSFEGVRRTQAKASLPRPTASNPVQDDLLLRLSRIVESALVSVHGSKQAAAITIAVDQSQMNRQLRIGTFDLRQSAAGGEAFLAQLGECLLEEFGAARKSKRQLAKERIPELLALMLDLTKESE